MDAMPRPRPPHLHREKTRHGVMVWYVRKGRGPRIRIKETFGTPEFQEAYHAAIAGERPAKAEPASSSSLAWLVSRYRESRDWLALSPATRKQRNNILRPILELSGTAPFAAITRSTVQAGLDRRAATPFQARHFLDTLRGLFNWAVRAEHISKDPTAGLKVPLPRSEGFRVWSEDDIARFEARWPVGTRERLALDILLYTGLRRGDAAALGRQHVKDGTITLRTGKTGQVVTLPILPPLAESIAASPTGDLAFIVGVNGRPMVKEGFGNWFRQVCDEAGVKGSAHGLRKAAATRLANNGATVAQLNAIFGWSGSSMASLYTKSADRPRLARAAMGKMVKTEQNADILFPHRPSGAGDKSKN